MEMSRRKMMSTLAMGAMAAAASPGLAASPRHFFERVGRKIGLQLYTLGDAPQHDLEGTLAKVAEIGYRDIELPSLYGRAPAEIAAAAAQAGLSLSSLHVLGDEMPGATSASLGGDLSKLVDEMGALGIAQAVLPIAPFPAGFRPSSMETFGKDIVAAIGKIGPDYWRRTAQTLNEKAAALQAHGIALGYHNHNLEFAKFGEDTGWSILARETDPALVHFEVDVGWVASAGLDPAAFLEEYSGRVSQLHVKDLMASVTPNVTISMDPAEVGSGRLDWAQILPAAHCAGVRNFYVEQEPPFTIPRMEAAAKSYEFLAQLRA